LTDQSFTIGGAVINRGERKRVSLNVARLYDFTEVGIPVEVIRGKKNGPVLFVCSTIHGDEINGIEIVRRLLKHSSLRKLRGTLIAVPIMNVYGFNTRSRYLPDGRDLNRSFPGSHKGSLAAQIADILMKEIISKATHGIDLHTGSGHRVNLPHVRASIDNPETKLLARAFKTPVIINSSLRDGSLREAAYDHGVKMLVFEGGGALRFDEKIIKAGLHGILSVMRQTGMIQSVSHKTLSKPKEVFIAHSSHWVRASSSGTMVQKKKTGESVKKGEILGVISDPFGDHNFPVKAERDGIIIGLTMLPLVNSGDALFHIATFENVGEVEEQVDRYDAVLEPIKDDQHL
jgi:predicted deacylase